MSFKYKFTIIDQSIMHIHYTYWVTWDI